MMRHRLAQFRPANRSRSALPALVATAFVGRARALTRALAAAGFAVSFALGLGAVWLLLAMPAAAHGVTPPPPDGLLDALALWSFDPLIGVPLIIVGVAYLAAVREVDLAHPNNPVPLRRPIYFVAGLVCIELALQSPIEHFDTTLFSVHMVQHVILTMAAAPLLALGAPITLLLRVATPDQRKRLILPILHSRVLRVVSFPVVTWLLFAAVMWGTHFSAIFDESLENPLLHDLEHLAFLGAALLFWWPVVAADPSPWHMPYPARILYVFLQMPQNSFLAIAILGASTPLYHHYATLNLAWVDPLADQGLAAGLMWIAGDIAFIVAIICLIAGWMKHEQRREVGLDARLARERAEIQRREARLADRLVRERPGDR